MSNKLFIASWDSMASGDRQCAFDMTSDAYQLYFNRMTEARYRLISISVYFDSTQFLYSSVFEQGLGGSWHSRHGMSAEQYQKEVDTQIAKDFFPSCISVGSNGTTAVFSGIWEPSKGFSWVARHGIHSADYQHQFDTMNVQGYRLQSIAPYILNNQVFYAAVWVKRSGGLGVARHGMDRERLASQIAELNGRNFRLMCAGAYTLNGRDYFAAYWEKDPTIVSQARFGVDKTTFGLLDAEARKVNLIPRILVGYLGEQQGEKLLNFKIQPQSQTLWCWAACSASIASYYNPYTKWTQCATVNKRLERTDCCELINSTSICNQVGGVDHTLSYSGNDGAFYTTQRSFADIRMEILAGRPIAIFITDHYIVIDGFAEDLVHVSDPANDGSKSWLLYTTLAGSPPLSGYRNHEWFHTIFSRPSLAQQQSSRAPYLKPMNRKNVYLMEQNVTRFKEVKHGFKKLINSEIRISQNDTRFKIYALSLESVLSGRGFAEAQHIANGHWVSDTLSKESIVVAEYYVSDNSLLTVREGDSVRSLHKAFLEIMNSSNESRDQHYEIAQLTIPSLYVEAVWLRSKDMDLDVIIPVGVIYPPLESGKKYSCAEMLRLLSGSASNNIFPQN